MRTRIAVTADRRPGSPGAGPHVRPARMQVVVAEAVVDRLRAVGAAVAILPPGDPEGALALLSGFEALVVTGGAFDIHPHHYGRAVEARLDRVDEARTGLELALCRAALEARLPILGICGGMQALVVAAGGTLVQDIRTADPGALDHEQSGDPVGAGHLLVPSPGWEWLGTAVNSTHHQAVEDPGPFAIVARAPDGVIEAVAHPVFPFVMGVQWHPELLDDGSLLWARLEAAARRGVGGT